MLATTPAPPVYGKRQALQQLSPVFSWHLKLTFTEAHLKTMWPHPVALPAGQLMAA